MSFCRHFKSLCKKNFYIWKRSYISSICELICPMALVALLIMARSLIEIEEMDGAYNPESTMLMYPFDQAGTFGAAQNYSTTFE